MSSHPQLKGETKTTDTKSKQMEKNRSLLPTSSAPFLIRSRSANNDPPKIQYICSKCANLEAKIPYKCSICTHRAATIRCLECPQTDQSSDQIGVLYCDTCHIKNKTHQATYVFYTEGPFIPHHGPGLDEHQGREYKSVKFNRTPPGVSPGQKLEQTKQNTSNHSNTTKLIKKKGSEYINGVLNADLGQAGVICFGIAEVSQTHQCTSTSCNWVYLLNYSVKGRFFNSISNCPKCKGPVEKMKKGTPKVFVVEDNIFNVNQRGEIQSLVAQITKKMYPIVTKVPKVVFVPVHNKDTMEKIVDSYVLEIHVQPNNTLHSIQAPICFVDRFKKINRSGKDVTKENNKIFKRRTDSTSL